MFSLYYCVCVYICVYMYTYMHICIYIYIYIHMYICVVILCGRAVFLAHGVSPIFCLVCVCVTFCLQEYVVLLHYVLSMYLYVHVLARVWYHKCVSAHVRTYVHTYPTCINMCTYTYYTMCANSCFNGFGWHYLSDATCLIRPRLFYALFIVSRITTLCQIIRNVWRTHALDK